MTKNARSTWVCLGGAALLTVASGCGPTAGAWMYTLGMVPAQKVAAEYKFPSGPLLILVDDDQDLVQPPLARQKLVDTLALKLREQKVVTQVTTNEEIARIRQAEPDFDQRGAREVGQLAQADTVLWLSVNQFSLPPDLELAVTPANFSLILKVINAKAEKREDVRLWPIDRDGRLMTVSLTPNEVHALKTVPAVHEKLAESMADAIAKLFYDYQIEQ